MAPFKLFVAVGPAAILAFALQAHAQQTLQQYAAECDAQIGVSVPAFDCADGTLIPGQSTDSSGRCDNPHILGRGQECDAGSTLNLLHEDDDVVIVAVCRTGIQQSAPGNYADIAVIQHNRDNGATCFYQRAGIGSSAPAPSVTDDGWHDPDDGGVMDSCPQCHDSGALFRSPFVTSVTGSDAVDAFDSPTLNQKGTPYWLVGDYYEDHHFQHVTVETGTGNACTNCHRMGTAFYSPTHLNDAPWRMNYNRGSIHFGQFAVRELDELQADGYYTKITTDSPFRWWMPPGRTAYSQHMLGLSPAQWEQELQKLQTCKERLYASNVTAGNPASHGLTLINDADCQVSLTPGIAGKPGLRVPDWQRDYQIWNLASRYSYLYAYDHQAETSYWGAFVQTGLWQFEQSGPDHVRIRNKATGEYLCHSLASSSTWLGTCPDYTSPVGAEWALDYQPDTHRVYRIESATFAGKYLYLDDLDLRYGSVPPSEPTTWWYTTPR